MTVWVHVREPLLTLVETKVILDSSSNLPKTYIDLPLRLNAHDIL